MPIVQPTKINNIIETSLDTGNHHRDRSVEDGPMSRLTELNRNSVALNLPNKSDNKAISENQTKQDKYSLGN
jgi:hypothetical protein